ncbi:MAG: hypothetical protein QOE92_1406 [Chloroflexota bacterium]|nr:hypothetical protein [Chloroflexota bacterium]
MTRLRIMDAARRLLTRGTYSSVTMEEIAHEAGVAYQTVYAVFGSKLQLAKAVIESGFHFDQLEDLASRANVATDPEVAIRLGVEISRQIHETCADLVRFMRESGDPELLERYHQGENFRLSQLAHVPALLRQGGRIQSGLSEPEVLAVLWAMTGTDFYTLLVLERGWTPARYEDWLGTALISMLLSPPGQRQPTAPPA